MSDVLQRGDYEGHTEKWTTAWHPTRICRAMEIPCAMDTEYTVRDGSDESDSPRVSGEDYRIRGAVYQ